MVFRRAWLGPRLVCVDDVLGRTRFDAGDVMGFLAVLAKKKGKLLKGGTPDRQAAARSEGSDLTHANMTDQSCPPRSPTSLSAGCLHAC
jgi:hypothetical protein